MLDRIAEKAGAIPEDVGRDAKAVAVLQRKHAAYESELNRLGQQVCFDFLSRKRLVKIYLNDLFKFQNDLYIPM